jgi:hypothetical protein
MEHHVLAAAQKVEPAILGFQRKVGNPRVCSDRPPNSIDVLLSAAMIEMTAGPFCAEIPHLGTTAKIVRRLCVSA